MPPKKIGRKNGAKRAKTTGNGNGKKCFFQYSEDQMRCAVEELRTKNVSVRDVAKK